jgi:hypothetical protein
MKADAAEAQGLGDGVLELGFSEQDDGFQRVALASAYRSPGRPGCGVFATGGNEARS